MNNVEIGHVCGYVQIQEYLPRGKDIEHAAENKNGFVEQGKYMDAL